MALDIPTLAFLLLLFSLLFSVGILLVQRHQPDRVPMRWWAAAIGLAGLAFLLVMLRPVLPALLSVVVANGMLLVALFCFYEGSARLRGWRGASVWLYAALLLLQSGLLAWFTFGWPSVAARIVVVVLLHAPLSLAIVRVLLRDVPAPLRAAHWFTAAAFLQMLAVSVLRGVNAVLQPPEDLLNSGLIQGLGILSIFILVVMCAFGCGWMIAARLAEDLRREARLDPLTLSLNRLGLEEALGREINCSLRSGQPFALILFDLDYFKQLNDRCGHLAGDQALRDVSMAVRELLRGCDQLARYGGDEFLALLSGATTEGATLVAERLRERVARLPSACADCQGLTLSYGIASFPADGENVDELIKQADRRLYAVKLKRANGAAAARPRDAESWTA